MSATRFGDTDAPYDDWAEAYRDWWGPIIEPAAVRVLERLTSHDPESPLRLLDVGTGTGALALAALERWPRAQVTAVDPAGRILEIAAEEARRRGRRVADRLRLLIGTADRLPLPSASVDAVVSSFVIQLVPSRAAAVREVARVLRPGGTFACVSWQATDDAFAPDDAFLAALEALELDPPPAGGGENAYTTPRAAAAELRRAGFRHVRARIEWLEHRFTAGSYLDVLEHWTDDATFSRLAPGTRRRLRALALERMRDLAPDAFVWRRPLISTVAERR